MCYCPVWKWSFPQSIASIEKVKTWLQSFIKTLATLLKTSVEKAKETSLDWHPQSLQIKLIYSIISDTSSKVSGLSTKGPRLIISAFKLIESKGREWKGIELRVKKMSTLNGESRNDYECSWCQTNCTLMVNSSALPHAVKPNEKSEGTTWSFVPALHYFFIIIIFLN